MKKPSISAYIITKNAEKNVECAIKSVKWMDEIIVLDSGSSDETVIKSKQLGAKVFTAEFRGFVSQKNSAMDLCTSEWIFNIDADEEVTPELRASIESVLTNVSEPDVPSVYKVSRKTYYLNRWIQHCGWYPEFRERLSKNGSARWEGEILHEKLCSTGRAGVLTGNLLHRPYQDINEHLQKIESYSVLWAQREAAKGQSATLFDILIRPWVKFLTMYIIHKGFLDYSAGLIASLMGSWYTFMKYIRLYEMTRIMK